MSGKIILAEHPEFVKKPSEAQEDISSLIAEGRNNYENEDYNKAIELFDKAIYINPKSAVAHFYKGNALEKLKGIMKV